MSTEDRTPCPARLAISDGTTKHYCGCEGTNPSHWAAARSLGYDAPEEAEQAAKEAFLVGLGGDSDER